MKLDRIIPVILIAGNRVVKTIRFKNRRYIGDALNTAALFSELSAQELIILDIDARSNGRVIDTDFVKNLAEELRMPFTVGGGISNDLEIKELLAAGAERVVLGLHSKDDFDKIILMTKKFGSSSIAVIINVRYSFWKKYIVYSLNNGGKIDIELSDCIEMLEKAGVGEIIIHANHRDGLQVGFDEDLLKILPDVNVPVVFMGGCGSLKHIQSAKKVRNISGYASGSTFIYKNGGILINYPNKEWIEQLRKN